MHVARGTDRCDSLERQQRAATEWQADDAPVAHGQGAQLRIWGHGALVAPDWSADWLHRETMAWLDLRAQAAYAKPYAELGDGDRAKLQAELQPAIRANTYDPANGRIAIGMHAAA